MKKFLTSLSLLAGLICVPQLLFAQTSFQGIPLKTVPGLFNLPIPSVGTLKTPLPLACVENKTEPANKTVVDPGAKQGTSDDDDLPKVKSNEADDQAKNKANADADSAGLGVRCPKFVISVDADGQTAEVDPQSIIDYVRSHPKIISGEVVDLPLDPDGVAGEPSTEQPNRVATGDQAPAVAPLGNPHPEVAISGMGGCNLQIGLFGNGSQAAWLALMLAPLVRFLKRK